MNNSFKSQIAQPSNQVGTTDDGQPIYEVELGEEVTKAQAKKNTKRYIDHLDQQIHEYSVEGKDHSDLIDIRKWLIKNN